MILMVPDSHLALGRLKVILMVPDLHLEIDLLKVILMVLDSHLALGRRKGLLRVQLKVRLSMKGFEKVILKALD